MGPTLGRDVQKGHTVAHVDAESVCASGTRLTATAGTNGIASLNSYLMREQTRPPDEPSPSFLLTPSRGRNSKFFMNWVPIPPLAATVETISVPPLIPAGFFTHLATLAVQDVVFGRKQKRAMTRTRHGPFESSAVPICYFSLCLSPRRAPSYSSLAY